MDNYNTYTEQLLRWGEKGKIKMRQRIKNWLIKNLGGVTKDDYREVLNRWGEALDTANDRLKEKIYETERADGWYRAYLRLAANEPISVTAQSEIEIDPLFGYTEDNVITQSKAQTIYELGKAVYPYAQHFITSDGLYIAAVNIAKGETK